MNKDLAGTPVKGKINIEKLISAFIIKGELTKMTPTRIANIRKKLFGLTQVAFAELTGINYFTLCRWERGRNPPTSPGAAFLLIAEQYPEFIIKNRAKLLKQIKLHTVI